MAARKITFAQAQALVQQGRKVWVEEILIRGKKSDTIPFGEVSGIHAILGIESVDDFGATTNVYSDPIAASDVPDQAIGAGVIKMADLIGLVIVQQQRTLDARDATIAALTADKTALQATIATQATQIAALTAQVAALTAQVTALTPATPTAPTEQA